MHAPDAVRSVLALALLACGSNAGAVITGTLNARFDATLRGGGVVVQGAGLAGREDSVVNATAAITIAGIPAGSTVQRALLYWIISGGSDTTATINAAPVTGVQVGVSADACWGGTGNQTFRADVTAQVTGNGAYIVGGLPSTTLAGGLDTDGVALVVTYENANSGAVRRVLIRDGAVSATGNGDVVVDAFVGVNAASGTAGRFHVVVGDGQLAVDGNLGFNAAVVGTNQFPGTDGSMLDATSYNVSVPAAQPNVAWTSTSGDDCLVYGAAVLDFQVSTCGDGLITQLEQCDDVNTGPGDGCNAQCQVEPGFQCTGVPSVCSPLPDDLFEDGFE